jgi:L-ribulokinase
MATRKQKTCSIGWAIDTHGVECAVLSIPDGTSLATVRYDFPKAPATVTIPGRRTPLPPGSFLRHPRDILPAMKNALTKALTKARATSAHIETAGLSHEASWLLAVARDGSPLADSRAGRSLPQAWTLPPLHRPPYPQAFRLTHLGRRFGEPFLESVVRSISPRSYWPRVWQAVEEAPEILKKADAFLELGDWLAWTLTGDPSVAWQACAARTGPFMNEHQGPRKTFLDQCDPLLGLLAAKLRARNLTPLPPWRPVGRISTEAARRIGLRPGTLLAAPAINNLSRLLGCGIAELGHYLLHWNEPTAHSVLSRYPEGVPGMAGTGENTVLPDSWSYEAVQLGVPQMLGWFEAYRSGRTLSPATHSRPKPSLLRKATAYKPGETGLLAMDWWEGDESMLRDPELRGVLIGLRPDTDLAAVYRALLESAAFGAYTILRALDANGVFLRQVFSTGHLLAEHKLLGAVTADVTGRDLFVPAVACPAAVGAALYAWVAREDSEDPAAALQAVAAKLPKPRSPAFKCKRDNHRIYERLYDQYLAVHDFLGRRSSRLMHDLARLRTTATAKP